MKGTMQISKLKKNAAYYYNKTYNRKYKDYNIFFMEPFEGTNDDYFYYVKSLDNGKIEQCLMVVLLRTIGVMTKTK